MDLQQIREALRRQPFEPFKIRLADGRSLAIPHPEMVAIGKRRVIVVEADDSWSVIGPLLIVSLDYNGKYRPRATRRNRAMPNVQTPPKDRQGGPWSTIKARDILKGGASPTPRYGSRFARFTAR